MKRFLSILLVAMLVVTCLATAAFAAESATVSVTSATINHNTKTVTVTYTVSGNFANFEMKVPQANGLALTAIERVVYNDVSLNHGSFEYNLISGSNKFGKVVFASSKLISKVQFKAVYTVKADKLNCEDKITLTPTVYFVSGTDLVDQNVSVNYGVITVDHIAGEWTVTKEATCTEDGVKTQKCTKCGKVLDTETIPVKDHSWGEWTVTKEPTCTEKGEKIRTCKVCGTEDKQVLDIVDHVAGEWKVTKAATCTAAGVETLFCAKCDAVMNTRIIPAKGHSWGDWTVTKEPTCTEEGEQVRVCKNNCGAKAQIEIIPELGHDYDVETTTATCTEGGITTYVCKRCGHTDTDNATPALGHDYKLVDSKAATCTEAGYEKYECSRCRDSYTNELKALGHQWCENFECEHEHEHYDEEYHWFLCMICGEKKDVERHNHNIEKEGYLFCECGHWIEVDEPGIDPQPKPGDYSFVMYAGIAALIAMMAAAYYVFKRKMAN